MENRIYSAGPCPICSEFGEALVVSGFQSGTIFLLCPACGAAWVPPAPNDVREFSTPDELAPEGLRLPDRAEILTSSIGDLQIKEADAARWWDVLSEFLIESE